MSSVASGERTPRLPPGTWVIDTSVYTHMFRAGHGHMVGARAPGGTVIVPADVNTEIEVGRAAYSNIPKVASVPWARLAVLDEDEVGTQLVVKAALGGRPSAHLGECAVLAVAHHRGYMALLDDRAAVAQASLLGVPCHGTLWLVIEAHVKIFDRDEARTAQVVDDLLASGMHLPVKSGDELLAWARKQGLLP